MQKLISIAIAMHGTGSDKKQINIYLNLIIMIVVLHACCPQMLS